MLLLLLSQTLGNHQAVGSNRSNPLAQVGPPHCHLVAPSTLLQYMQNVQYMQDIKGGQTVAREGPQYECGIVTSADGLEEQKVYCPWPKAAAGECCRYYNPLCRLRFCNWITNPGVFDGCEHP